MVAADTFPVLTDHASAKRILAACRRESAHQSAAYVLLRSALRVEGSVREWLEHNEPLKGEARNGALASDATAARTNDSRFACVAPRSARRRCMRTD
jgi:hypothetical protein